MKTIKLKPGHDEILPDELSADELRDCVAEAVRRGMVVPMVIEIEAAYEVLLEGRSAMASELLSRALFPNGCDIIRSRVEAHKKQALERAA